ncbi:HAD hydrolase-like protein [Actinokineospora auranticolor]|uniref:Phosphoglycolate phosphatase n=1 Tax=Actinokineospora auranticolor TaxID=155976 RepID=A0A2S6GZ45_9PSEU|nr:HAD hydrolase-like protein [Actinokineospora auranticolor]PPK70522.1 phosphoglycolate phosphatase [Actinokineospora auranticolor]
MGLAVGFDLDMTLIDPRPGMVAAMAALAAETGFDLDGEHFAANLGPPLEVAFRGFAVPEARIPALATRFRAMYPEYVVPVTIALPGAGAALESVRAAGGRTLVVTGKYEPNAARHIAQFGWHVDALVGNRWSVAKAESLREHGAAVYVGDHEGDMAGARAAGALAVGVTTGPCTAEQLRASGADAVLTSLEEFPAWLSEYLNTGGYQSQKPL